MLQSQIASREDTARLFAPLAPDDPLREEYSRTAEAADAFIKLADENKAENWMRPAVLYLGGLAKYSLGDSAGALTLLERLHKEFPDYKRNPFINERDAPNDKLAVPVAAGISKLIFHLRLQTALQKTPDAFSSIKQIIADALSTLAAQREYAAWLLASSDQFNRREFDEALFGSEPDQRRAGALPRTLALVEQAWEALLEKALKKAGAKAVREWLRSLSTPDAPLARLATLRLQNIDALVIKSYFAEAQSLMKQNNFDAARAKYKQIIAEYPDSDAAKRAEAELPKIVPVAVAHYKSEGEKNFRYKDADQLFVPQTKAREYFEKMYKEDPDGPQSDYALLKWSEALGSEAKIPQMVANLNEFLKKYPKSPLYVKALYLLGFSYLPRTKTENQGLEIMWRVLADYPTSPEAPEALWHMAFAHAWNNRFTEAAAALDQLQAKYPDSPRHRHAPKWSNYFKRKIADGSKWP